MHDQVIGRVSVTRCAELLSQAGDRVDRSALSRYCDSHGLKLPKVGKEVMVDFEAVRDHRAQNFTREVMSGTPVQAPPMVEPRPSTAATVQLSEHRELKAVQLRQALREEAIAEGRLTSVAEVDAGMAEAVVAMRAEFAALRAEFAEGLAARLSLAPEKVRTLRDGLKAYDRQGQARFAERMAAALKASTEETADAVDRLNALAALSLRLRGHRALSAAAG